MMKTSFLSNSRLNAALIGGAFVWTTGCSSMSESEAQVGTAFSSLDRPYKTGTPAEIPLRWKEINPGFYMVTGRGCNSLIVQTDAGLLLVDTKLMYPAMYTELKALITKKIGKTDFSLAFVTHHHADCAGGNAFVLEEGVDIVGQSNILETLDDYKSIIAPVNPAKPTVVFDEKYQVIKGTTPVEAYYWGPAHTDADIAVYFPDSKIVAAGDLVFGTGELAVDMVDGKGSLLGMLSRVDDLLNLDFELLVPGHGDNVMTRSEVELYRKRLALLIERGKTAIKNGVPRAELYKAMRSDDLGFQLLGHFWRNQKFTDPLYDELSASVSGGR